MRIWNCDFCGEQRRTNDDHVCNADKIMEKIKNAPEPTFDKRVFLNDAYKLVYPALMPHETRGYNAHTRAQILCDELAEKVEQWILSNKQFLKQTK